MNAIVNIPDKNYYFLLCDTPAIDYKHRIDQLNHMGFIADGNKENMVNYFQKFSRNVKPVVFIYQNKIHNLGMFMDQKEFDRLNIKQSYNEIPRLKLSNLMQQQADDLEFVNYNSLGKLPEYRRTKGVCNLAIQNDPYNIRYIPDYMLSREFIESAVTCEGNTLQYISRERLNVEICRKAIENDYMALQHVPFEFRNEDLCRIAAKRALSDPRNDSYRVLSYIPYTFICNETIRQLHDSGVSGEAMAQAITNKEVMSPGMCDKLFEWDYNAYKYFPHLYKSKEMTEKAVSLNGILLAYVPSKRIDEELCLKAIKNSYKAMEFVPVGIKTPDFCLKAVQTNGNALGYIPPAYRSRQICEAAANATNDYVIIRNRPYPDLCLQAMEKCTSLKQLSDCIHMLPVGIVNKAIAYKIAEYAPDCLATIPNKLKTKKLCDYAIKHNPLALEYIPDEFKTREICIDAIKRDVKGCSFLPENLKSESFYMEILRQNSLAFIYIPEGKRTPEICLFAVKKDPEVKNMVPVFVKKNKNIYSFNDRLEKILTGKDQLTFDEVKNLYMGNAINIKELKNGEKILKDKMLSYGKEADKFQISTFKADKKTRKNLSL